MSSDQHITEHIEAVKQAVSGKDGGKFVTHLRALRELLGARSREARLRRNDCSLCSKMKPSYMSWSCGDDGTPLAEEARHLLDGVDFTTGGGRTFDVVLCPECTQAWSVRSDYEYLAGGSEDELYVTRLDAEELIDEMLTRFEQPGYFPGGLFWEDWGLFRRNLEAAARS